MVNSNGDVYFFNTINDFECNILSFTITIQPKTERLASSSFVLNLFYLADGKWLNCI